jgi:hypothetical protein
MLTNITSTFCIIGTLDCLQQGAASPPSKFGFERRSERATITTSPADAGSPTESISGRCLPRAHGFRLGAAVERRGVGGGDMEGGGQSRRRRRRGKSSSRTSPDRKERSSSHLNSISAAWASPDRKERSDLLRRAADMELLLHAPGSGSTSSTRVVGGRNRPHRRAGGGRPHRRAGGARLPPLLPSSLPRQRVIGGRRKAAPHALHREIQAPPPQSSAGTPDLLAPVPRVCSRHRGKEGHGSPSPAWRSSAMREGEGRAARAAQRDEGGEVLLLR